MLEPMHGPSDDAPDTRLSERVRDLMEGSPASSSGLRVATSLRRLTRWLVSHGGAQDEKAVEALADALEQVEASLESARSASRFSDETIAGPEGLRESQHPNTRGTHPLIGRANPVAPPIQLGVEDELVVGDLCFDVRHEGMPSCAHGGYIAAGFDIVMIQAASSSRNGGGVTGTLSVRYVGLTPIDTPLRYEAWLDRSEGRKTFVKARLRTSPPADSTEASRVTAEAEGIFISVGTT
jgi:acyl-coenzyme A thioesterase PaaI-like protein